MKNKKCSVTPRRPSKNPALREVLHALDTGASIKVKDPGVLSLVNSLSRTTKRRDGTRFSVKSLSKGVYKVTRVKAQKPLVYKADTNHKLYDLIVKLRDIVREEIKFLESLA